MTHRHIPVAPCMVCGEGDSPGYALFADCVPACVEDHLMFLCNDHRPVHRDTREPIAPYVAVAAGADS